MHARIHAHALSTSSPSLPSLSSPSPNNHSVPARDDDVDADVNTSASDHDSPSLKLHSHRQNYISSRLPSYRPADLKNGPAAPASSSPPSQQYLHHHKHPGRRLRSQVQQHPHLVPPSSISPNPASEQQPAPSIPDNIANVQVDAISGAGADSEATRSCARTLSSSSIASSVANSPPSVDVCSRASSHHVAHHPSTWSSSPENSPISTQRPASCPGSGPVNADQTIPSSASSGTVSFKYLTRRGPASCSSNGVSTSDGPPSALSSHRLQAIQAVQAVTQFAPQPQPAVETSIAEDSRQGQLELLLPKRLSQSSSSDESPYSPSHRPPISYRSASKRQSIQISNLTPGRVPPIRSFRSSGSRKSLTKDMNFAPRPCDVGDSFAHSPQEQSQSALEGRYAQPAAPPSNIGDSDRCDDTGDVFLRIAREEPIRHMKGNLLSEGAACDLDDTLTSVSGLRRSHHRRPVSTVIAAYHHPTSPPKVRRRLSDQQDRPQPKYLEDDQASAVSLTTTFRSPNREKALSVHPGDEILRTRSGGPNLRPSPLSARSVIGNDSGQEGSVYARRRASITESNSTVGGRTSGYKASGLSYSRNYSSSPLIKAVDFQNRTGSELINGVEGTESTASTTAPSTVWDELDDLKSRIHRLELTGKLPSTSGAAVSRLAEDRPATATTTVTTMSLSPKRQGPGQVAESSTTTTSQKEAHPILHAALAKSKPFLSPEVYQALEAAANDAMSLSSMMGSPGQTGPISGAASVIGAGGAVVDRQLRRKADSVCRSLTELCVALGDGTAQPPTVLTSPVMTQNDGPATPTVPKSFSGLPAPRRASVVEQAIPKPSSSPRTLSKFEERRSLILNGTTLPTPRSIGSIPNTPVDGNGNYSRRSSLMIARTRRAGTEEPDLTRTPSVLRSRRAGTEEPEESRQPTILGRSRRGTVGEEANGGKFRPPSRAGTDVSMFRAQGREYPAESQPAPCDASLQIPSALPRRRFLSTNLHSARSGGSPGSNSVSPRRYLDRQPVENDMNDGTADALTQRHAPLLSKGTTHTRASSLSTRRNRDSFISTNSSATLGAYR